MASAEPDQERPIVDALQSGAPQQRSLSWNEPSRPINACWARLSLQVPIECRPRGQASRNSLGETHISRTIRRALLEKRC
jgi:hypothetical protein